METSKYHTYGRIHEDGEYFLDAPREHANLIAKALNFYERDRPRMLEARVKRLEEALESIQAVTPTTYPEVCLLAGKALEDTKGPES